MAGVGPQVVQVLDFATARAPELQALHEAAGDAKPQAQRNQRRRRANAFKSHKMPRRLRLPAEQAEATHEEEHIALGNRRGSHAPLDAGAAKPRAKREPRGPRCRKHRRRMHVLLEERSWLTAAAGDQDMEAPKWLATHAWHAKRMQMREAYGHVLAQKRQDKSVSAALTALRKTATLHDASYVGVLELYGVDTLIIEALQLVTDPSGSEFDETRLFLGAREGRAVLHHANQFPSGAIAPVRFQWRPLHGDEAQDVDDEEERAPRKRQLWIWIHAAAFMEAATAIASACREVMSEQDGAETIEILDRRGHLARLELRGKAASAMVDRVLQNTARKSSSDEDGNTSDHDDGFARSEIFTTTVHANLTSLRARLGKTTSRMRPRDEEEANVFTVTVQDPRLRSQYNGETSYRSGGNASTVSLLHEPTVDTSSAILCPLSGLSLTSGDADEPDSARILAQLDSLLQWTTSASTSESVDKAMYPYVAAPKLASHQKEPTDVVMGGTDAESTATVVACSELWSLSRRYHLRNTFVKDHTLNRTKQRSGDAEEPASDLADVPLMLVRQSSAFPNTGGWDVILSPVFAPAFLNAFVFSGAMVIGLDEHEALATVVHEPSFPRDFPDTAAGREYWGQLSDAQESEYAKKPKAKRVAYDKLGVSSPFQPDWDLLFDEPTATEGAEDNDGDEEMEQEPSTPSLCVLRSVSYMEPFPFSRVLDDDHDDEPAELIPVAVPTLIRVALSFPRRAALEPCSMLYIPTEADLASFHRDDKWSGRDWEPTSELGLLGFVTSALYDRPMSSFRGTAFCACEELQRLAMAQLARHEKKTTHLLALTRTPSSRQLRPVFLHIQA